MSQPPARSLWGAVLKNFLKSLKPRQLSGDLKGTDYNGTKYFERPADSFVDNRRRASRWFEPKNEDFQQDIPAEWESWLRGRRAEPPTEEEILKNLEIMKLKKQNAVLVDAKAGKMTPMEKGPETFPKRPDYEITAGRKPDESN